VVLSSQASFSDNEGTPPVEIHQKKHLSFDQLSQISDLNFKIPPKSQKQNISLKHRYKWKNHATSVKTLDVEIYEVIQNRSNLNS